MSQFHRLRGGERITVLTAHGQQVTGRVNPLLIFPTHCVIDIGRGRPVVVTAQNITRINGIPLSRKVAI
jgi:hypothetical protein